MCMPFPMIQDEEELELAHEENYHEIEGITCARVKMLVC